MLYQKLKGAACHKKQLEPYTPSSNTARTEIKELKKGASHKMLLLRAPKYLWDDCSELEAYFRFNTSHDIYQVDGKAIKMVMPGESSDIS